MISAADAVEKAAFDILDPAIVGAAVFQHVPEDTLPPVVIIGDIETEPMDTKGDTDRRVSLTIVTVTEAEERKPILELQRQIEQLLDAARITVDAWSLSFVFAGADATLTPDGGGYVGNSRFDIFAFMT